MALEIPSSNYSIKNFLIFGFILLGVSVWFINDGYNPNSNYYKKEMEKGEGQPTLDLKINRATPFLTGAFAIYCFVSMALLKKRKIVADDNGLQIDGKTAIPYSAITKLDKRNFQEKGYFILFFQENGSERALKFSDKHYDKLGLLLDEIISKAGGQNANAGDETASLPDTDSPDENTV